MKPRTYDRIKRAGDVTIAGVTLVILSPVLLATAATVRITLGSPVLFRQARPGRDAEPFTLLKFRTMTDDRGGDGEPLPDADRLTTVGRWLRATSVDELPELINVLQGEMSIVGPRPLLMRYLDRYTSEQARRHEVPPGITGLVAVSGRNALTWEEKLGLDVWYVDHRSFSLDMRILAKTVPAVLTRAGVRQPGSATAEEFRGTGEVRDE